MKVKESLEELELKFWLGNEKAKAIWKQLGPALRSQGWTWPHFLKLLSLMRYECVLYMMEKLTWNQLLDEVQAHAKIWAEERRRK